MTLSRFRRRDARSDSAKATTSRTKASRPLFSHPADARARCSSKERRGSGKAEVARGPSRECWGRRLVRLQCYEGPRRRIGRYEVELSAADDPDPASPRWPARTIEARRSSRSRRRHLHAPVPHRAPPPSSPGTRDREAPGAATTKARPARTNRSRRICWSCWPTSRHDFPSSVRSRPKSRPSFVITSNRTGEIHDAIKRPLLLPTGWTIPDAARELEILRVRAPGRGGI